MGCGSSKDVVTQPKKEKESKSVAETKDKSNKTKTENSYAEIDENDARKSNSPHVPNSKQIDTGIGFGSSKDVPKEESKSVAKTEEKIDKTETEISSAKIDEHATKSDSPHLPNSEPIETNMGCASSKGVKEESKSVAQTEEKIEKTKTENSYAEIDEHARKAPAKLKNSAEELISYLSTVSKDPEHLARGIFVWISENIRYDVDGYFGRAKGAPYDSEGVMKCGRAVCEGYANVMKELCSKANIPVKKISGFAKGARHSADQEITESTETNHAWNAVQIEGKWQLIDSTWGAGHLNSSNEFEKEFNEFYFLANPKHIITSHFPYMDGNMKESMEWQLLDKKVSLPEFSRGVKYKPSAFKLGARAVSHTNGLVEMKNDIKMVFRSDGPEDIAFSARLMLLDGNYWREQRNATYGYPENGVFTLNVHPPKVGKYTMDVFGHPASEKKLSGIPQLMTYVIKCTEVKVKDFEYPGTFAGATEERIILREPMSGKLPSNKEINFKLEAPYLQTVRVGKTLFDKSGNTFTGSVKTGPPGQLSVYGNRTGPYDSMQGLLYYTVV